MSKTKGFGDIQNMLSGNATVSASDAIAAQKAIVPKLTTAQRDALAGADLYEGLEIYNLTTHKKNLRTASAWEVVTSA